MRDALTTPLHNSNDDECEAAKATASNDRCCIPLFADGRTLRQWMARSVPTVDAFLDGTIIYVLSRQWIDLFATHLLRLHPLPFCCMRGGEHPADDLHLPCTPEAPAMKQAAFAGATLLVAASVQRVASLNAHRWPSAPTVTQMAGMCAGWACGGALLQALQELGETCVRSCTYLHVAFSLLATAASAVLILLLRPSTLLYGCACVRDACLESTFFWRRWRMLPECSSEAVAAAAMILDEFWTLFRRALSVTVAMLWNFSLKSLVSEGVPLEQMQGPLYVRMLLFFAISLTAGGGLVRLCQPSPPPTQPSPPYPGRSAGVEGVRSGLPG